MVFKAEFLLREVNFIDKILGWLVCLVAIFLFNFSKICFTSPQTFIGKICEFLFVLDIFYFLTDCEEFRTKILNFERLAWNKKLKGNSN